MFARTTRYLGGWAVGGGLAGAGLLLGSAACGDVYENCDVVGDGLRGEFWKSRHSNIEILGLENVAVQTLITKLRDRTTSKADFRVAMDRLLSILVEQGLSSIDPEEVTVETPDGHKFAGVKIDVEESLLGVNIDDDSSVMLDALERSFPSIEMATLSVQERGGSKVVTKSNLPASVKEKQIILLDPLIGGGSTLEACLKFLKAQGVEDGNITVLAVSMSPQAAAMLRKYKGISVVSAAIESDYVDKRLVPGFGYVPERYGLKE